MTPAQKNLRAWAYSLARGVLKRVNRLQNTELRVSMLKSILDTYQPGLSAQVEARAITYRRLGHTYDKAMEHAIAEAFMKIGAGKLNNAEKLGDVFDDIIETQDETASGGRTTNTADILGSITSLVGAATSAAERIHGMIEETAAARAGRRQERREWASEAERERIAAEERVRAAREERELEALRAEEAREIDLAQREREELRAARAGGSGIGSLLLLGGAVTLVGVGGYYGYKYLTKEKG